MRPKKQSANKPDMKVDFWFRSQATDLPHEPFRDGTFYFAAKGPFLLCLDSNIFSPGNVASRGVQ